MTNTLYVFLCRLFTSYPLLLSWCDSPMTNTFYVFFCRLFTSDPLLLSWCDMFWDLLTQWINSCLIWNGSPSASVFSMLVIWITSFLWLLCVQVFQPFEFIWPLVFYFPELNARTVMMMQAFVVRPMSLMFPKILLLVLMIVLKVLWRENVAWMSVEDEKVHREVSFRLMLICYLAKMRGVIYYTPISFWTMFEVLCFGSVLSFFLSHYLAAVYVISTCYSTPLGIS